MKVLLLDNYDSFSYNLKQLIDQFGVEKLDILKNDQIDLGEIEKYDKIMLSPGPGLPSESGLMIDIIQKYGSKKAILGVCLGHHAIAEVFGAKLFNFNQPVHGIARQTHILKNDSLFKSLSETIQVGLYHSWAVSDDSFPKNLEITARSEKGIIMAIRHKTFNIKGVQFHPESIMTPMGKTIIWNWLEDSI
jgi:anthranilate synthase component 2